MAALGKLRYAYLAFFSKPAGDRGLYRLAKRHRVRSVLELGVPSFERTLNLLGVCQRYSPGEAIRYAGLDAFDERPSNCEPLSLKETHRQLKAAGAEPRLMPGGPAQGLPAVANSVMGTDLVLISSMASDADLEPVWFYLPRILGEQTTVLRASIDSEAGEAWKEVSRSEIAERAARSPVARAA